MEVLSLLISRTGVTRVCTTPEPCSWLASKNDGPVEGLLKFMKSPTHVAEFGGWEGDLSRRSTIAHLQQAPCTRYECRQQHCLVRKGRSHYQDATHKIPRYRKQGKRKHLDLNIVDIACLFLPGCTSGYCEASPRSKPQRSRNHRTGGF